MCLVVCVYLLCTNTAVLVFPGYGHQFVMHTSYTYWPLVIVALCFASCCGVLIGVCFCTSDLTCQQCVESASAEYCTAFLVCDWAVAG